MRKTILILSLLALTGLSQMSVKAQFSGGDGSAGNPYIITTASELATLATYVNAGNTAYNNKNYKLNNNISLATYQTGSGWMPIGNYSNRFKGVFDGNNKEITGLYINTTSLQAIGLFGSVGGGGTVKNLGLVNVNISLLSSSQDCAGGVSGYNEGTILNCYSTGVIIASSPGYALAGGVMGFNDGTVSNCYSTASVSSIVSSATGSSAAIAGGVSGYNEGTISNCYSTGMIIASSPDYALAGGVTGSNDGTVSNCAALNPKIDCSGYVKIFGRITGENNKTLTNNIGYNDMLNPNGSTTWSYKSLTNLDGLDITLASIHADGTLGGRFTSANGWTIQNGKLPGLFGQTVDMPSHLSIPEPPTITTTTLPNGTVGTTYTATLTANGDAPITWEFTGGSLPAGLSLSNAGTISGTPTTEGTFTFTVKATNTIGNATIGLSITISASGVGIAEMQNLSSVQVYPNPAQNTLYIMSSETVEEVSVYDISGRMLQQTTNPSTSIDVSSLANGIYLVKVRTATGETIKRIVISD